MRVRVLNCAQGLDLVRAGPGCGCPVAGLNVDDLAGTLVRGGFGRIHLDVAYSWWSQVYGFVVCKVCVPHCTGLVSVGLGWSALGPCGTSWSWKPRPGKKVHNRRQSPDQAAKSRTGEKVDNRFQSPEQAVKLRTGEKVDNRRESPRQAAKSRTGEKVCIILGWKKPRPGVEPRTGVYVQPAHRTPERGGDRREGKSRLAFS